MSNKKLRTLAALTSALIAANAGTFAASADSSAGFNSVIKAPETDNISYISGEYSTLPQIKDTDRYELSIEAQPEKTVYYTGEELDLTGLELACLHQPDASAEIWDGNYFDTYEIPLSELIENGTIVIDDSEFDNTKAGTYTIYIHYGTATDSFEVTVEGKADKPKTDANGDANGDGEFTIADVVTVQKAIMGKKTAILSDCKAADLYEDGIIDVYDFILMRKEIIKK